MTRSHIIPGIAGAAIPGDELARSLRMTLNRLKLIATIVPIVAVVALEGARAALLGSLPLGKRLQLDALVIGAIVLFSSFIFRYVAAMQRRLERQNDELMALHGAGLAITAELSLDAVLKKVVDEARNLVGAKYGAVSVVDDQGRIEQFVTSGISTEQRAKIGPPPVGHGVLGVVLHEGQHLRLKNLADHPKSVGFPANHPVMKTLLAVPIACKGPFVGNIYLSERHDGGEFSRHDEETLMRFAVQAGIAIDNAHLHAQAADLAVAQERLRIAHEMHDGLAQVLGYVNTKVQAADAYLKRGKQDEASMQLQQLAVSAREAYTEVREGIVGLRTLPNPDEPITGVLRDYLGQWQAQTHIATELTVDGEVRLRPTVELQLVRIVQESLTNIRKHARATKVGVTIRKTDGVVHLTIADDGVGFDTSTRHRGEFPQFGLTTMRERAESIGGTLAIESAPGKGTTVRFDLPLTAE